MTLAMPDLDTDLDLDVDIFTVIDSYYAEHCESKHTDHRNRRCSHVPVARFGVNCGAIPTILICQNAVNFIRLVQSEATSICEDCRELVSIDWHILPLE